LFNPFFSNRNYDDVNQASIAAHFYYAIGESDKALAYAQKSTESSIDPWRGYELKGLIIAQKYFENKSQILADEAIAAFDKALAAKPKSLESLYGKAVSLMEYDKYAA